MCYTTVNKAYDSLFCMPIFFVTIRWGLSSEAYALLVRRVSTIVHVPPRDSSYLSCRYQVADNYYLLPNSIQFCDQICCLLLNIDRKFEQIMLCPQLKSFALPCHQHHTNTFTSYPHLLYLVVENLNATQ
jgi:hypothetical protein